MDHPQPHPCRTCGCPVTLIEHKDMRGVKGWSRRCTNWKCPMNTGRKRLGDSV